MPEPSAVLFDFDGVIADTENVHVVAWERTFEAMGWDVSPEACARAAEVDDRAFLAEVFEEAGVEGGDVEGWCRRKQALAASILSGEPRLFRGVAELVRALSGRGVRLAVVSTTWRENVGAALKASGLADAFERIVGKEDVSATKPDPECYLLALRRLGLDADLTVALEDSPTGLAAARAAGVRCVAVGHRRPPGDWAGEAPYLPDLSDTARAVDALGFEEMPTP